MKQLSASTSVYISYPAVFSSVNDAIFALSHVLWRKGSISLPTMSNTVSYASSHLFDSVVGGAPLSAIHTGDHAFGTFTGRLCYSDEYGSDYKTAFMALGCELFKQGLIRKVNISSVASYALNVLLQEHMVDIVADRAVIRTDVTVPSVTE